VNRPAAKTALSAAGTEADVRKSAARDFSNELAQHIL
jgi:hypothetical protein